MASCRVFSPDAPRVPVPPPDPGLRIPADALGALIGSTGDPNKAAIIDIENVQCTTVGSNSYLSFTGVVQFGK